MEVWEHTSMVGDDNHLIRTKQDQARDGHHQSTTTVILGASLFLFNPLIRTQSIILTKKIKKADWIWCWRWEGEWKTAKWENGCGLSYNRCLLILLEQQLKSPWLTSHWTLIDVGWFLGHLLVLFFVLYLILHLVPHVNTAAHHFLQNKCWFYDNCWK